MGQEQRNRRHQGEERRVPARDRTTMVRVEDDVFLLADVPREGTPTTVRVERTLPRLGTLTYTRLTLPKH